MSSSLGTYSRNIDFLMNATIVQDNACIPCVFEKMSINNPVKNDIVKTIFILRVNGNLIIKYINIIGVAILNKHILLHIITCVNINMIYNII